MSDVFNTAYPCLSPEFLAEDLFRDEITRNSFDEEEDHIGELIRRMARSAIYADSFRPPKIWGVSDSPQSTLHELGSPHETNPKETWDVLYAAAGEIERMREGGVGLYKGRGFSGHLNEPNHVVKNPIFGYEDSVSEHMLQAIQFERMKKLHMMKQLELMKKQQEYKLMIQNRKPVCSSVWPAPQKSVGMRKVSSGTGVFLPRSAGITPEAPKKKPGCSTVLLPARVVHALNLDVKEIGSNVGLGIDGGVSLRLGKLRQASPSNEVRLPQEWTY